MNHTFTPHLRRTLLALTCAAALCAPVLAQEASATPPTPSSPQQQATPGHGAEMQQHQLEHLTKALSLTPDQVTQVKAIEDDGRQQMMALRNDTSTAGADRHTRMKDLHEAQNSKIKAILNDDQKTRFDAMQAQMRERRDQRREGSQPPPPASSSN